MTDAQTDRLAMFRATLKALDAHADAWAPVTKLQTYRDQLDAHIEAIRDAARRQADPTQATTDVKASLRTDVTDRAADLADALTAYAEDESLPDLAARADLSHNDLVRLRDPDLAEQSEIIAALARTHLDALDPYGVTPAEVDALDALDDEYALALETPRAAIIAKSRATSDLAAADVAARRLLDKRLDRLANRIGRRHPDFGTDYRNARVIVDRPGTPAPDPEA